MKVAAAVAVLVVAFLGWAVAAQAQNGYGTNFVRFAGGTVERTHLGEWQEFGDGNNSPRFHWRETNRDEWSVYLRDDSRQMDMQIDMHRRMISLAWPSHPMADQYPITEASDRINGRLVTSVNFDGGRFTLEGGTWQEYSGQNPTNRFRETGRDQWSAYARDDGRQMDMQIDMHTGWIRLAWPGHPMADQYRILSAQ